MIHTDSYYEIGSSHTFCQDYALSGKVNRHISFAIVSDGCSSSPNVDVGARLITHSVKDFLKMKYGDCQVIDDDIHKFDLSLQKYILLNSCASSQYLSLPFGALNATLVVSVTDGQKVRLCIYGDGGVIVGHKDGTVEYFSVRFMDNAPYYLYYDYDPLIRDSYFKTFGEQKIWTEIDRNLMDDDNLIMDTQFFTTKEFSYDKGLTVWETSSISYVINVSDGIESFLDIDPQLEYDQRASKEVSKNVILKEICLIKNYNGNFIQRRLGRMKRDHAKINRIHFDDISAAAMYITEGENVN